MVIVLFIFGNVNCYEHAPRYSDRFIAHCKGCRRAVLEIPGLKIAGYLSTINRSCAPTELVYFNYIPGR